MCCSFECEPCVTELCRLAEELTRRERLEFYKELRAREQRSIDDLLSGPAVGHTGESCPATSSEAEDQHDAVHADQTSPSPPNTAQTATQANASFAKITQVLRLCVST